MSKKNKPDNRGFVYSTDPNFKFEENQQNFETLSASQQKLKIRLDTKHRGGQGRYADRRVYWGRKCPGRLGKKS